MRQMLKQIPIYFLGALVVVYAILWQTDKYELFAHDNTNMIRDTQLLLEVNGVYKGKLDGNCSRQTLDAIERFEATLPNKALEVGCTDHFLQILKTNISTSIKADTSAATGNTPHNKNKTKDAAIAGTNQTTVEDLDARLNITIQSLEKLNDRFSTQFVTQFNNLSQIGASAFVIAISMFFAFSALVGNLLIKDAVKAAHENELERTQSKLNTSIKQAAAKIYSLFGCHCINLYKDLDVRPPSDPQNANLVESQRRRQSLYESYLGIAIEMSQFGYSNCEEIQKSLGDLGEKISPDAQRTVAACLNNYVFYLAARCNIQGRQEDKVKLGELIPKLIEIKKANAGKTIRWDVEDTLVWAELQLGNKDGSETKVEVVKFLADPTISDQWKGELKKRYKFHDDQFPAGDKRRVNLP